MRMVSLGGYPVVAPFDASIEPLPPDQTPSLVYLASLALGSRRTMRAALATIAAMIAPGVPPDHFPWHRLRYQHTAAVRARLAERYAPTTANKMLSGLKAVLRHAFHLGLMDANGLAMAVAIKTVKGERLPRGRALSVGEVGAVFACCDPSKPGGARNAGVLGVLFGGGLRRSEVVRLDREHYDDEAGSLRVRGKGNVEKTVFLPAGARRAVGCWLRVRGNGPGPLFCPVTKGGTIVMRYMSDQSLLDLVRRLARRAQVARFSPHDLRRSYVTTLLQIGVDLAVVQRMARHASVSTTIRYDRRPDELHRQAADTLHVPFMDQ